jgi:hypothetical protein
MKTRNRWIPAFWLFVVIGGALAAIAADHYRPKDLPHCVGKWADEAGRMHEC